MSTGSKLGWIVGLFAAATAGLAAGIWIGGEMEAGINHEIMMRADLPAECWEKFQAAAERIVSEYEGNEPAAPETP